MQNTHFKAVEENRVYWYTTILRIFVCKHKTDYEDISFPRKDYGLQIRFADR